MKISLLFHPRMVMVVVEGKKKKVAVANNIWKKNEERTSEYQTIGIKHHHTIEK